MIQKTLLATAAVAGLAVASVPAYAAYYTDIDLTSGYAKVTGYDSGNDTYGVNYTYQLTLRDLNGSVSIQTPPNGYHEVDAKGSMTLNLSPSLPLFNVSSAGWQNIFSGIINTTGLTLPSYTFNFTPGTLGSNDGPGAPIGFGIEYDGQASAAVMGTLNTFLGSLGLPTFSGNSGKGKMDFTGTVHSDGMVLNIHEYDLDWIGFGGLMQLADTVKIPGTQIPLFGKPNELDATIESANVTLRVPEPTTLALLGLGVLGLGLSRSRKAKAA